MSKKLIGIIASFALVLSMVGATTAQALTSADIAMLQAAGIINATQAASLSASIAAPAVSTSGYSFAKDLTLGAKGADVTALQQVLVNEGYLKMPAGVAYGYFGALTKSAVIKYQLAKGITPAAGYFGAKTRAIVNGSSSTGSTSTTGGVVVTGTDLAVSLAPTSPMTGAIVSGQAAADLAEFTFTNKSATPAVVTNVTLARGGVSADTSLANVYLYNGAVRLTDAATVSSGKITFNASTGLFTVPAGSSYTIAVKADIAGKTIATAGQIIAVSLTGVTANLPVSAVYPVSGASMTVASADDIATVSLSATTYPSVNPKIQAGTLGQTIWQNAITISNRAVYLRSLALKVIGSIPSNSLQNIKLFVGGVQVATASGIDANSMITFDLTASPYKVDSSRTFEVRADVVNGSSRSFSVSLQNAADLQIYDSNYNVGIAGSNIPASTVSMDVTTGSVSVTQDSSLASGDIVTGSSNVPLARYTFKAYGEDMKVSYMYVASTQQLDNVSLFANGVQIGSTQTISATTTLGGLDYGDSALMKLYNIGSSLVIPAGTSVTVEVRGDIKYSGNNLSTGGTVQVGLVGYTNNTQGSYSQQLITVPSTEQDGVVMSVKGANLTVAANSGYSTIQTSNPNTSGVKLGSYVLQAGSAEALRITSLTVNLGGLAGASTNVSNLRLVYGNFSTTPINPASSGSNNFSVDFTVPANGSQIVDVFGDLGSVQDVATTSLPASGVSGYGVNSNLPVTNDLAVNGQTITSGQGTLAVPTLNNTSPDAQLVVGNSTSKIADFNFISSNGASTISEMYFDVSGPITSLTVGGNTFPVVGASSTANGLNISIPIGYGGTNVPVLATYANIGLNGVDSLQTARVLVTGYKYTSGNNTVSTTSLSSATTTRSSNPMVVVASKPVVTLSNPTQTVVVGGTVVLGRVTIAADAKGDVSLMKLPISVIGANNAHGTAVAATSSGVKVGSSVVTTTGGIPAFGTTTASSTIDFGPNGYVIPAGTSVTFDIYGTVVLSTGDSVQLSITNDSDFVWKDVAGNATTTGAYIYNFPTNSSIINYTN